METTPGGEFGDPMFTVSLAPFLGADLLASIQFNDGTESYRLARES